MKDFLIKTTLGFLFIMFFSGLIELATSLTTNVDILIWIIIDILILDVSYLIGDSFYRDFWED